MDDKLDKVMALQAATQQQIDILTSRLGLPRDGKLAGAAGAGMRNKVAGATGFKPVVSNSEPIVAPAEPTITDNILLFIPPRGVCEYGLEPNMDDKGDTVKEMWYGRVWELRALLAIQYKSKLAQVRLNSTSISPQRMKELDEKMNNPLLKPKLLKVVARWKGSVYRQHCGLKVLDQLKFSNLRGVLVYCHGSGGCSWDNFRICRMCAMLGMLVIAPDGFAYPKNTAMGQMRHKDLLPLKTAYDDVDYWTGDLMYASGSQGELTYSTKAEAVLDDPNAYRSKYEKCYQLRRSEMHFVIRHLPQWIKTKGFFLGGTSEGAMTVARFDDQRYGEMICGRFINSFSVEYCYFTPTPQDGELGGQLDIPTLNIIGTKDQYFGPEDSVAKIVAEDDTTGYGDKNLTGNGYKTFVRQGVDCALVCVLQDGVHSPCNTHDNFLRQLFDHFFTRPGSIWELDAIWNIDPTMKDIMQVKQSTENDDCEANVTQVFVPRMQFPNKMSLRQVEAMRLYSNYKEKIAAQMAEEERKVQADQKEAKDMLDKMHKRSKKSGGGGFQVDDVQAIKAKKGAFSGVNYYATDRVATVHKKKRHHHK